MRYLTDREKGGILYPDYIDERIGTSVLLVLESKHPDARIPDANAIPAYQISPDFVDLDITKDSIEVTAHCLSRGAGLRGTDAHVLQEWLLLFSKASCAL